MKAKTIDYLSVGAGFAAYFAAFAALPQGPYKQVLVYALVFLSLFNGLRVPLFSFLSTGLGIVLLFIPPFSYSWVTMTGALTLLGAAALLPFYYDWSRRWEKEKFEQRREPQTKRFYQLQSSVMQLKEDRKNLEAEIEKISQLYVLGRELVEHMEAAEVVEHLQRILLNRPGIKSVSIFLWDKSNWKPLSFSQSSHQQEWMDFIKEQQFLCRGTQCSILISPRWLENEAVVFWPVRLEKELLAGIILTADTDAAPRYVEEGNIFIPQIALGMKRTQLFGEVKERSRLDGLTGLYRRSYFLERLQTEIKRAERYKAAFSLLMIDIDHFKKVNDTRGHVTGDEVLRGLAKIFTECVRDGDMLGRYGGEEFVAFLYMSPRQEAQEIAHRIGKTVAEYRFASDSAEFSITVSVGISHYPADGTNAEELLSAADQALYWVKTHGRNGVKEFVEIVAEPEAEEKKRKKKPEH